MPRRVKEERLARVIALQDAINARRIARSVGALEEVLIDSANPKQRGAMNGRTGGNRPVTVPGAHLEVGDLVQVRITAASGHWLTGEFVEEAAAAR